MSVETNFGKKVPFSPAVAFLTAVVTMFPSHHIQSSNAPTLEKVTECSLDARLRCPALFCFGSDWRLGLDWTMSPSLETGSPVPDEAGIMGTFD